MNKLNKNQSGFGLVLVSILVVIAVIVISSVFLVTKSSADCNKQYNSVLSAAQPKISELNNIALLGEQPVQKANVQRSGDCVDSRPYVTVNKTYSKTQNGGASVDTIRASLKSAGYTISNEDFGSEGCKLHYKVKAQKNDTKIYAVASQKDIKDSSCSDGYPKSVTEAYFRGQNIDYAELRLQ